MDGSGEQCHGGMNSRTRPAPRSLSSLTGFCFASHPLERRGEGSTPKLILESVYVPPAVHKGEGKAVLSGGEERQREGFVKMKDATPCYLSDPHAPEHLDAKHLLRFVLYQISALKAKKFFGLVEQGRLLDVGGKKKGGCGGPLTKSQSLLHPHTPTQISALPGGVAFLTEDTPALMEYLLR